jgi:hypothetical protein
MNWSLIAKKFGEFNGHMSIKNIAVIGLCLIGLQNKSEAQIFTGAAAEALGGAGRAALSQLETHYLNPAGVAFVKPAMDVGAAYKTARAGMSNPESTTAFTITDNSSERAISGGFGYVNKRVSSPTTITTDQDFSLSFSTKIIPTLSVGVGAHRLVRQNTSGPSWAKYNVSAGILIVPIPIIGFSLVGYDMINDDDLDLVPTVALGSHLIIMDILRLRADVTRQEKLNPEKKGSLNLGMELNPGFGFLVRTGGWWDGLSNQTYWTGGLAWEGPNLSVAYGMRNNVNVNGDISHTMQAWIVF